MWQNTRTYENALNFFLLLCYTFKLALCPYVNPSSEMIPVFDKTKLNDPDYHAYIDYHHIIIPPRDSITHHCRHLSILN